MVATIGPIPSLENMASQSRNWPLTVCQALLEPAGTRPGTPWFRRALLVGAVLTLTACDQTPDSMLFDLDGQARNPLSNTRPSLVIFVDSECPISNRYAPAIQDLQGDYAARVAMWLIYPNPKLNAAKIRAHVAAYKLAVPALRDPDHKLVKLARARVTPEAAVFDSNGTLVYHGRIDDRFVDFNQQRPAPTRRDVAEVLDALLAGQSVPPRQTVAPGSDVDALHQPGVGCFVADLK